ncbi:eyes shut -like protein [Brachionus plicatilis]|uniref:Eyes shut-like protein n=1 Tax=Brachionus plicatilis TaxID=10195 RepID=A0A3M7R207_BRAPC|nr:eyes shut -like protein [Brachionus plicatilis]
MEYFASGSDDKKLRIWNKNSIIDTIDYDFKVSTLDYDSYNNALLIGSSDEKLRMFFLANRTTRTICNCAKLIRSIDQETFVSESSNNQLNIYNIQSISKTSYGSGYNNIKEMKLLKSEKKLLIAQHKSVVVFNLETKNEKSTDMRRDVYSLDVYDKNFIVNQNKDGNNEEICIHKIEQNDVLAKQKCTSFSDDIIVIKIINEKIILFGSEQTKLHRWGKNENSVTDYSTPNNKKILSIEQFNNQEFIVGDEEGRIYKVNLINFNAVALNNNGFEKVYALALIDAYGILLISTSTSTTTTSTISSTTTTSTISSTTTTSTISSTTTTSTSTSTTTTSTSTSTTTNSINTSSIIFFEDIFEMNQINIEKITELFTLKIDINNCLLNCSNNGKCRLNSESKYVCECVDDFIGDRCQHNTRPCYLNRCRNNATCIENSLNKIYSCECFTENNQTSLYYGIYCEKKIDVCSNETCSNHGYCKEENNAPICVCFYMYSGDKCENESEELKKNKMIVKTTTIIAIIVLISFFIIILCCDFIDCLSKRKLKRTYFSQKSDLIEKRVAYIN